MNGLEIQRNKEKKIRVFLLFCMVVFSTLGWFLFFNSKLNNEKIRNSNQTLLSDHITETLVKSVVWYHSRGKLEELRLVFMDPNYMSDTRTTKIRIENMLKHRTSVYIREFNQYKCSIDNLGNWYQKNFDFENFLNDVFLVVFDKSLYEKDKDLGIVAELKIKKIRDIMEKYQNQTSDILHKEIYKEEM